MVTLAYFLKAWTRALNTKMSFGSAGPGFFKHDALLMWALWGSWLPPSWQLSTLEGRSRTQYELFSTYVVFPLIYLLNILQFVLVVDTAADADFCDKSTIFVYINFLRCPILFSFISFLFIFSLKHNNQSVLMVDITAGAEFCHGDTIFSIAQLVMRTLLFSYLIFLRYDMFFVNQVALFFYLNKLSEMRDYSFTWMFSLFVKT